MKNLILFIAIVFAASFNTQAQITNPFIASEFTANLDKNNTTTVVEEPKTNLETPKTNAVAHFDGGSIAFTTYLAEKMVYPKEAEKLGLEGTVKVRFIVNTDGSLEGFEVIQSVDPMLDFEAVRAVQAMPNWMPAWRNGRPVRSKVIVPVQFSLW